MEKRTTNMGGLFLIALGSLALLHTTILPLFGWDFSLWRLWPFGVGAVGLFLVIAPFVYNHKRGLKALLIPGVPILVISTLLLWGSVFNAWGIWEIFWPLLVLGLALGFFLTAVFMRNIWFMIPAIIVGVNGAVFQFCAITGWWEAWSILWTLEPLSVGLALLVASAGHRKGLFTAGIILTTIAAVSFGLMSLVLSGWASILGAAILILTGAGLLRGGWRGSDLLPEEKAPPEKMVEAA